MSSKNGNKWQGLFHGCLLCFAMSVMSISLIACGSKKETAPIFQGEPIALAENGTGLTEMNGGEANKEEMALGEALASWEGESAEAHEDKGGISVIWDEGETLETRIIAPIGYQRVDTEEGSLAEFLRQYPLKPAGYKVHLYDGTEKGTQTDHVAVFDLPIEDYDLQQCADSVMRVYAEWFWATEQYDRIQFHFTSGFLAEYPKWRDGYRVTVNGNNVSWIKSKSKDTSYDCFVRYLRTVFCYAGTLSMEKESEATTLAELKAGDVFLYGGSPGHVVMVVDVCENEQGKKAFLLAQGYMPAQEFHLLKNDRHPEDPWYYEEEVTYPFQTPEYTFDAGSLRSLNY